MQFLAVSISAVYEHKHKTKQKKRKKKKKRGIFLGDDSFAFLNLVQCQCTAMVNICTAKFLRLLNK